MDDDGIDITPGSPVSPGTLRFLKVLVIALTATMMIGIMVLIGLIVMRFSDRHEVRLPDSVVLPAGVTATAFTRGPDWLAVVTDDDRILIYAPDGTTIRQDIAIERAQ